MSYHFTQLYAILEEVVMLINMLIGVFAGGYLGYLYHKKVGCASGTCPITSNRYASTIYGALLGLMISTSF